MEFGKVETSELERIDFALPPDDPRTWVQLAKHPRPEDSSTAFHIGCPIWGAKDWVGSVYPPKTQARDFLYHYSRQFSSIELNTTHYRIPTHDLISRWKEATPEGFRFCPKWPQDISHRRPIHSHEGAIREFVQAVMGLEERLGLTFLQLAPTFEPSELDDLRRFLKSLPEGFPIAIEFRHPRFFKAHQLIQPAFEVLDQCGASTVITDVAGRRDVLHTTISNSRVLVRLIGNDFHLSDDVRVCEWSKRLTTWSHLGMSDVFFFLHQPSDINMPEFVARFIDRLNTDAHVSLAKWHPMNQGEQLGLF